MNLLILSARIVDPNSPFNGKTKDILIENGKIVSIKDKIPARGKSYKTFRAPGLCISPGWFDMHANFRDPGHEYKEDIHSGLNAAAAGGFTGVALMPSTRPPVSTKPAVEYILRKSSGALTDIYPIGCLSAGLEGKDLSEMYDMHLSGAVAFSDDKNSVADAGLLIRAMLYAKNFNSLIIHFPSDKSLAAGGQMNEGASSTHLGMKGIPAIAEEIVIARDLYLAEYTGARLHFSTISTAGSVNLIRQAKRKGLKVTAEVAAHQFALDDSLLSGFDSHFKVNPPLRTKKDIKAIIEGLKDGTIDVICSDHSPENIEKKKSEFDYAAFGISGIETCYALANKCLRKTLTDAEIISRIAIRPREILGITVPSVRQGQKANITLFDNRSEWVFDAGKSKSKSGNTPFSGTKLKGRALGVFNNGQFASCL